MDTPRLSRKILLPAAAFVLAGLIGLSTGFPPAARAEGSGGLRAYEFARLSAEPVGRSMSGAHVAAVGGPAALAWNPAGLAAPASAGAMISHASWLAGTAWQYGAVSLDLPGEGGTVGLSAGMLRIGSLPGYAADGSATGEFTPFAAVGTAGYARPLTDRWQVGVCAEFFFEGDGLESPEPAPAGGAGLQYAHPLSFGRLAVGASVLHLGAERNAGEESFALPATYRAGVSLETTRGLDLHAATESTAGGEPTFSFGLAWHPTGGLAALGGFGYDGTADEGPLTPSFGLALDVGPTQVAYSYQPTVIDEGSHQIALYIPFTRP